MAKGTDYGSGQINIDPVTGIRFGVVPVNDVIQVWGDESEPEYGDPTCPKCGEVANTIDLAPENYDEIPGWKDNGTDYTCNDCKYTFDSDEAYDEALCGWKIDENTFLVYRAYQSHDDSNIFITKSPYYTFANYCNPCAPGAGYLRQPIGDGARTYCFGHDWFEGNVALYPIFRVDDNSYVAPMQEDDNE